MRRERIHIPLKAGHHRPTIFMAFRWRADGGPILNAGFGSRFVIFHGIRTSIGKEPYNFVLFRGGGGGIWIRACLRSSLIRVEFTVFASMITIV